MKRFLLLMLVSIEFLFAGNQQFTYVYRGKEIALTILPDQISVEFKTPLSENRRKTLLQRYLPDLLEEKPFVSGRFYLIRLGQERAAEQLLQLVSRLEDDEQIAGVAPVFKRMGSRVRQTVNRSFIVRFRPEMSENEISTLLTRWPVRIRERLLENTYVLETSPEQGMNGIEAANHFGRQEGVLWAQPNFYYLDWELLNATVNDPLWSEQWAHRNTGQTVTSATKDPTLSSTVNGYPDADVDADLAWDVLLAHGLPAGGSRDILVALLDSGVDLDHPDLDDNLISSGVDFSPDNGSDANDVQGHGTSTSGIVAAEGNNGIGVAGIAYHTQILPVKIFTTWGMAEDAQIAEAFDYAWQNGADVISNSWSGSSPNQVIDDAIHRAKTQGRGGKGCVVVFSSGNAGKGEVSYPGYLTDVIAVGASNMFDEKKNSGSQDLQRSWGGNYGSALDLVAPTIVYTTDIAGSGGYTDGDYMDHFGGTSAACPHVAAVAALVLSADSTLTSDEVQDILQRSADKIDLYAFDANGWNKHVGYGRVNAYRAVKMAFRENGDVPVISLTPLQPTSEVTDRTVSAVTSDADGIASGSLEPVLRYRTVFQGDTSAWQEVRDSDGPAGDRYEFVIPAQSWGTLVEYYLRAYDNSGENAENTFPFKGEILEVPPRLLRYYVGDFSVQTYPSNDVPVSIADDNVFYTSTLNIGDHRRIVDLNVTISISGFINDLAVTLEAPNGAASGIVGHNGSPGDRYSNTRLDDEASTPITEGSSPYSGTYQPDNALIGFDAGDAFGTWKLKAYDDTYYNNGSTIENWSVEITYLNPLNPPVVSDIPNQTIDEGGTFTSFDLDDYVTDADNTDDEITWTVSGNQELIVSIDSLTHVATVQTPNEDWYGSETLLFTATDPTLLSDSDSAVFTVNPVNDPPVVSDIPDQTIAQGDTFSSFDLDDYVSDVDNTDSEINWDATGNEQLVVEIDPQTHVATVTTPSPDWTGQETITFVATDPGGLSDSDSAVFTVEATNQPPVVSDIPDQTIDEGGRFVSIPLDDYVDDPDNVDEEISWTYQGNQALRVSIDSNRVAIISTPDSNWNGRETITFTATDPGGLSDSDSAVFTVNPVNDPPRIVHFPDSLVFDRGDTLRLSLANLAVDVDDPPEALRWSFRLADSGLGYDYRQEDREVWLFSDGFVGVSYLFARVEDDSGAFDLDTALFLVQDTLTTDLERPEIAIGEYRLFQNFPNPFNPSTTIRFELKAPARMELAIYNLSGQQVQTLLQKYLPAGIHEVRWSAQNVPSGIYFYRFTVWQDGRIRFRATKKLVLLK